MNCGNKMTPNHEENREKVPGTKLFLGLAALVPYNRYMLVYCLSAHASTVITTLYNIIWNVQIRIPVFNPKEVQPFIMTALFWFVLWLVHFSHFSMPQFN